MTYFSPYLHLLESRSQLLLLAILLGCLLGSAPLRATGLPMAFVRFIDRLGSKLDRAHRSTATLVYRGMIALILLLVPAATLGTILSQPAHWAQLLTLLWMAVWFGWATGFYTQRYHWIQLRDHPDAAWECLGMERSFQRDIHSVIRASIVLRTQAIAEKLIGASFWFLLGGLPLMFAYSMLQCSREQFHARSMAFGWATRRMSALMDTLPRLLARVLFALAACFTPGAKPLAIFRGGSWRACIARLLDCSLETTSGNGWVGEGSARVTHAHAGRCLILCLVTTLLLLLALATPLANKTLF